MANKLTAVDVEKRLSEQARLNELSPDDFLIAGVRLE